MNLRPAIRETLRVLVLDQDPAFQRRLGQRFERDGHFIETTAELEGAEASMKAVPVDAIIASYEAAGGADGLARLSRLAPTAPLLVTLSESSVSATVAAMRSGADDVIIRRAASGRFATRLMALARSRHNELVMDQRTGAQADVAISAMIGISEPMRIIRDRVERFAKSDAPVLISGLPGTGREFIARLIHDASARARETFLIFDCANADDNALQAELIGPQGAKGLVGTAISRALGGTLVLKNAHALPNWAQAAIAERLIASTNTGLADSEGSSPVRLVTIVEGADGSRTNNLRPVLFHALAVLTLTMPALRARREDILPLARAFLAEASAEAGKQLIGYSNAAERRLLSYDWPGNLDELKRIVTVSVEQTNSTRVEADALLLPTADNSEGVFTELPAAVGLDVASGEIAPYRDQERWIIERALEAFDGNITRAAAALEISPSTIHRKRQMWADDVAA